MSNLKPLISPSAWRVHGHEWAVEYLQRIVDSDHSEGQGSARGLRHAYLFAGPPQVGKTTIVRAFAQALLCTGRNEVDSPRPCGACRPCQLMARGQHPDFRLVSPTDSDGNIDRTNGMLRRPQADELIHEASLRPVESRYKIFAIQDAHLANLTFSNKVLKTLEEPPRHVIICVTATDRSELLPTIVSRCEVMELRPLPVATTKRALIEDRQVEPERAELLARLCGGRFGWAVRQLEVDAEAEERLKLLEDLRSIVVSSRVERLRIAEKTAARRDNLRLFSMLELWVTWWRDVLLTQHGCGEAISNIDQRLEVDRHARELSANAVQHHLETLKRVEQYLHHTVNTRLAMDALLLDVPRPIA